MERTSRDSVDAAPEHQDECIYGRSGVYLAVVERFDDERPSRDGPDVGRVLKVCVDS